MPLDFSREFITPDPRQQFPTSASCRRYHFKFRLWHLTNSIQVNTFLNETRPQVRWRIVFSMQTRPTSIPSRNPAEASLLWSASSRCRRGTCRGQSIWRRRGSRGHNTLKFAHSKRTSNFWCTDHDRKQESLKYFLTCRPTRKGADRQCYEATSA